MTLVGKHIIAIDDTHSILTFLRISLEALGATFSGAVTAAGGLSLCEAKRPDLIVLDIGLPDKEGIDILQQLKRIDKNGNLPVIMLTVRKEAEMRESAARLGADAYITKPFIMDELVTAINQQLQLRDDRHLMLVKSDAEASLKAAVPSGNLYPVQ